MSDLENPDLKTYMKFFDVCFFCKRSEENMNDNKKLAKELLDAEFDILKIEVFEFDSDYISNNYGIVNVKHINDFEDKMLEIAKKYHIPSYFLSTVKDKKINNVLTVGRVIPIEEKNWMDKGNILNIVYPLVICNLKYTGEKIKIEDL